MRLEIDRVIFDELDSTNDFVKKNSAVFDPKKLTLVLAKNQTAGKGQYGRSWLSTSGNFTGSYCFDFSDEFQEINRLSQFAALILLQLLRDLGLKCHFKWPNDLLIDGQKVSGILAETVISPKRRQAVIGIGVNIEKTELGTSFCENNLKINVVEFEKKLSDRLQNNLLGFLKNGFSSWQELFEKEISFSCESQYSFFQSGRALQGIIKGAQKDGALILKMPDGKEKAIYSAST